jgi:hypothetical protein
MWRCTLAVSLPALLAACSTIGQITVKDYEAKSGERVMAGQAEPKDEYRCEKLAQEKQDWGLAAHLDEASAMKRVTSVAVDSAPGKGANYAYIIRPSEMSIGGFNINAFRDAQVAYYKCGNLPERKS